MSETDCPGEVHEIRTICFSKCIVAERINDAVNNLKLQLRSSCKNFQDFWAEEYRSKYPGFIPQLYVRLVICCCNSFIVKMSVGINSCKRNYGWSKNFPGDN